MRSFDLTIGDTIIRECSKVTLRNPFDGTAASEVTFGGPKEIELATRSAIEVFPVISRMPARKRTDILRLISSGISNRLEELADTIRDEAGKTISLARIEVERAVSTFSIAADEALRIQGDFLPLDGVPSGMDRIGLTRRYPIGPVLAISPFNFPLNLVAHKVAPAIAAGNSIVVKPSSQAPGAALLLAEIARDAGLPPGVLNVIPCLAATAEKMVADDRFNMLTFTGSAAVGWELKSKAGKKRITLELGGNAAAIVEPDADISDAVSRLAIGAFAYAGQICISVQRIFVHESIAAQFTSRIVDYVKSKLDSGDPANPNVICGPLIDSANADRIEEWIADAHRSGARILCGGEREGNIIKPTVLTDVDPQLRIASEEAFGPVVVIDTYSSFEEAIHKVNDSRFGLQAGIFTQDIGKVMQAFRELKVGGVIHNDAPTFRVDSMPYGGTRDSGIGREGVRYAIEEMTEPKLLVVRE